MNTWGKNTSKFNENFINNYDENSNKRYIFEVDVEYPKRLHNLQSDLPFLPERMKIKKCSRLACNLYDKNNYVVHIRTLKQALNHGLVLKKMHKVMQFNQKAWLKLYITNTKLRTKAKNKAFFKLMNNGVFGRAMGKVRKHRDIKLVIADKRRNYLVSELHYHTRKWFSEGLLTIQMKKIKLKMNKPVYLGLSVLEISGTLMYEFWYYYIKSKFQNNAKLYYMKTDSFIIHIKTVDFCK